MFLYDAASGTASSSSDDEMDAILQQLIDIIEG